MKDFWLSKEGMEQCDQMDIFLKHVAIYNNENLPNSITFLPK